MEISDSQKLILVMLADIYERLEIKNGVNPELVRQAIYGGHHWAIQWEHSGIFGAEADTRDQVNQVVDILDMWEFIELAVERLTPDEREDLKQRAEPFGHSVKFRGFDGNGEARQIGIARMLIEQMGRWQQFAGRDLNAHYPSLEGHMRMVRAFEPIRVDLGYRQMNLDDLITVLSAQRYPDDQ